VPEPSQPSAAEARMTTHHADDGLGVPRLRAARAGPVAMEDLLIQGT
jgi:hypothetical protein